MNRSPLATATRIAALTAVWVLLWGNLSFANVLGGLAASIVVLWLFPMPSPEGIRLRPIAALRYAAVFAWLLVVSTWDTAVEILRRHPARFQGIVVVPLRTESEVIATAVANSLSLTPGTLSIDVRKDPMVLYVHGLRVEDPDDIRATARRLEDLALAAFGRDAPEETGPGEEDPVRRASP